MKVTLFMAMTVNGYIARNDGTEDFLSDENWKEFCRLAKKTGCFVVGRKTYETVQKLYRDYNYDDVESDAIVVSRKQKVTHAYTPAVSPRDALAQARKKGYNKLLLSGGGMLNTAFMKADLIDEIILNIEPALLGSGVRVFADDSFYRRLVLKRTRRLPDGIMQLRYTVRRNRHAR